MQKTTIISLGLSIVALGTAMLALWQGIPEGEKTSVVAGKQDAPSIDNRFIDPDAMPPHRLDNPLAKLPESGPPETLLPTTGSGESGPSQNPMAATLKQQGGRSRNIGKFIDPDDWAAQTPLNTHPVRQIGESMEVPEVETLP